MSSEGFAQPERTPALQTKILLPRRRPDVLSRPRLLEFLSKYLDRKLLIISAPAGYGKTTLLVDFAHQTNVPVCWLTLTSADTDPRVFLEALVASVRHRFPDFGDRILNYLRHAGARDLEVAARLVGDELHQIDVEKLLLVLDDVHTVDEEPSIQELIYLITSGLPSNCCCALLGRAIPRIRISWFVANREAYGLGAADLRFTADEIRQLFLRHFQLVVPNEMIEKMVDDAEGWIAGIILTSHLLWQGLVKGIIQAKRRGGPVFDYLAREVFDFQDQETREFLLRSSVLTRLNAAGCDALLERSDSAERLSRLDEENLFLTRLEGEGDWYRYHSLFQEFLRERLRQDAPEELARLHLRAGAQAEAEGEIEDALGHYLAGGDGRRAADLVESAAATTIAAGRIQTFLRWAALLPEEHLADRPRLNLERARAAFEAGNIDLVRKAVEAAWESSQRAGEPLLIASARIWRSLPLRAQGKYDEAAEECRAGLAIAESEGELSLVALGYKQLGLTLSAASLVVEAVPVLERALATYSDLSDDFNQGVVSHTLGVNWKRQGHFDRARRLLDRAEGHWRRIGNDGMRAMSLVVLGNLRYEGGQLDEASQIHDEARRLARESGYLRMEGCAIQSLGNVLRDQGDLAAATEAYETSLALAERVGDRSLQIECLEGLARARLYAGDQAIAFSTISRVRKLAADGGSVYERGLGEATLGLICLQLNQAKEAEVALERACAWLETAGAQRELARARLYRSLVLWRAGKLDAREAARVVDEALASLPAGPSDPFVLAEARYLRPLFRVAEPHAEAFAGAVEATGSEVSTPVATESTGVRLAPLAAVPKIRSFSLGRGDVEVSCRALTAAEWVTQKTRELWFYLVAQGPVSGEQIVAALWPEAKGPNVFHQTTYRLRNALPPGAVVRETLLWRVSDAVEVWADDREFEELASDLRISPDLPLTDDRIQRGGRAFDLYLGPYLPGVDGEWATARRRRLKDLYVRLARGLIEHARVSGQHQRVVACAERFLETEPDDESAHEALMRSYDRLGNRAAALRHYHRYAEQLREELKASPPRRLRLLSEQLSQG